jgi:hypothetical protein
MNEKFYIYKNRKEWDVDIFDRSGFAPLLQWPLRKIKINLLTVPRSEKCT